MGEEAKPFDTEFIDRIVYSVEEITNKTSHSVRQNSIYGNNWFNGNVQGMVKVDKLQHGESIGCIRGEFVVEKKFDPTLAHGVFQPGKKYPVWLRFSNSASK